MLDTYLEMLINQKLGSEYEDAFDFTEQSYDEHHASLNFYRVYSKEDGPVIIRMSGRNIKMSEKNILADVLIEEKNCRLLTAKEKEIYLRSNEENESTHRR